MANEKPKAEMSEIEQLRQRAEAAEARAVAAESRADAAEERLTAPLRVANMTSKKGRQWNFNVSCAAVTAKDPRNSKPGLPTRVIACVDESEAKRLYAVDPEVVKANGGRVVDVSDRNIVVEHASEDERRERFESLAMQYIKAKHPIPNELISSEREVELRNEFRVSELKRENELRQKAGLQPVTAS